MHIPTIRFRLAALLLLCMSLQSPAQYIIREGDEAGEIKSRTTVIPYAFSTETLGFGVGIGATYGPKSQALYYGTAYATDNGSAMLMLGGRYLQAPFLERLHFYPRLMLGHFSQLRIYADGNPDYAGLERAGSNESSPDNYIEEDAQDLMLDLEMHYTLPWGHYRQEQVHTYITRNGLLHDNPGGGESWNPLTSGKSSILFRPYYRRQLSDVEEMETLFFELGYQHDNRDYVLNPHRGYLFKTTVAHDPDWLAETRRWTTVKGRLNGYIPLPDTAGIRQQTLALAAWAAYTPTYKPYSSSPNDGKPPYFTDPTLGGFWRLRGYPSNRFHDKAALLYSAEYRIMPEWQPFGQVKLLDPLGIRWWQIVGLVEVGRVAPEWDLKTLHTDMKYDVGIGLRGMFHHSVGRMDLVYSEEATAFIVMLGQTF